MRYLAVTLGHNSSALYYDDATNQVLGYEEERLTRKKNDSAFPINALNRLDRITGGHSTHCDKVLVSHWFDHFDPAKATKYWDPSFFGTRKIESVDHHTAHAWSAVAFYEEHAKLIKPCDILVVDGFGNDQNCYSLYTYDPMKPLTLTKKRRVYGYSCSMGLLYQWAAEMCGMDGQADVYKFLGYRTKIDPLMVGELDKAAQEIADIYITRVDSWSYHSPIIRRDRDKDGVIDGEYFQFIKEKTIALMSRIIPDPSNRPQVGYVVQAVLEKVIGYVVDEWIPKDPGRALLVAGGCFYNVRLNMILNETLPNNFCPMPVAGDQGCGFGLIRSVNSSCIGLMKSLNIGPRVTKFDPRMMTKVDDKLEYLSNDWIVNLVDGSGMEFGPRALCHTSTLCLPTEENVQLINSLNERNTVMPMAPVMTRAWGYKLFGEGLSKMEGGEKFMIAAFRYLPGVVEEYGIQGAAHLDLDGSWSGRPQIVDQRDNSLIHNILFHGGWPCLINTSLNYHGEPICFGPASVMHLHSRWQLKHRKFVTLWLE